MIWIFVILTILALFYLERRWAPHALEHLRFSGECDLTLAQPGETVRWKSTVENHSRLPIPFVRLELRFPNELVPAESDRWLRDHCAPGIQKWHVEERLSLGGHRSRSRTLSFVPAKRGEFALGSCRLSVGDLLGFEETSLELPPVTLIVMPETAGNKCAVEAVSGFLGDLSVRRFILEDPILTTGFRDYTGREPMKDISWTRTATAGKLMVKQYDHTAERTVTILLNVEGGSPEELEGTFRLMRTLCETLEARKIPFSMRTNGSLNGPLGKLFHLSEGLGSQHLNTILYSLGRADYTCYHSFSQLARTALDNRKSNESYIVITPRPSDALQQHIRKLEAGSGNPVCVLYGSWEVKQE